VTNNLPAERCARGRSRRETNLAASKTSKCNPEELSGPGVFDEDGPAREARIIHAGACLPADYRSIAALYEDSLALLR
jgi:hypothetical protein